MPNKSKNSRSKENNSVDYSKIIIGSVIGTIIFFVIIAFFSVIALKSDVFTKSAYMPLGLFSAFISSFIGGFITVRLIRQKGALFGALTGLLQSLVSSAAVFFINERNSGTGIFIFMAVIIIAAAIGGISAVNMKSGKKYK